jgi:hypothetical protein
VSAPSGTPSTVATVNPETTVAIARPARSGGTSDVTVTSDNANSVACAIAAMTRPVSRSPNADVVAHSTVPAVKRPTSPRVSPLRGRRAVATVTSGPPMTTPSA